MVSKYPQLVAHRGYAYRYPENTLLAIQAAVEAGAHFVEFDVLMTADQVPVLFHDRDMQRMCGVSGAIHEYSLAQLKELNVYEPEKFGQTYLANKITTLEEIVAYLNTVSDVVAFVELKRQGLEAIGMDIFVDKVLSILKLIKKQVVIISYSLESLLAVRQRTDFPVAAVFDNWLEKDSPFIQQLKPEYLFTDIDQLPETGDLRTTECTLAVYECVDPEKALAVHQRGVDMVETFQIKEMLDAFKEG
jgi:glycerophosphoryl diester phosphodiesterase